MKKLYYPVFLLIFISCKEDNPPPVSISFALPASEAVESAGSQSIIIEFDRTTDQAMELTFTVTGDAALNGDYKSLSGSPLSIAAGTTTASIDFDLIDEFIIEAADKSLVFSLVSVTNGMLNSTTGVLTHTFTLKDNDVVPNNALQFDLTWTLGSGVDIDLVDFDLLLITNLVESGGVVTGFDTYTASIGENSSGFETVFLVNTAPDDDYYALVIYADGSSSGEFLLALNNTSFNAEASGTFTADDSGGGLIIGPIVKSGSSYSARTASQSDLQTHPVSDKRIKALLNK